MYKPSYSAAQAGAYIIRDGYSWSSVQGTPIEVTYAFRQSEPSYNNSSDIYGTFSQFNAAQVAAATTALELWSDIANISFVPLGSGTGEAPFGDSATILFGNYSARDGAAAFAYLPSPSRTGAGDPHGDVWVNRYYGQSFPAEGNYSNMALVHEIGHVLGLGHPGDYNALDGVRIAYANSAEYLEDTRQYSVMSYFSASKTGADHGSSYPTTPLMHDIVALQMLYGANYETRSGETTYGFGSNAGGPFAVNGTDDQPIFSVWDGGGEDTFNFSGYRTRQTIDLREESFSSVGGLTHNVSIAPGVTIENALGGLSSDLMIGNDADNKLYGMHGNDTIYGFHGNDRAYGHGGSDRLYGHGGNDALLGQWGRDILVGGHGNDWLAGGSSHDWLIGGPGADFLYGGSGRDVLRGGSGADIFNFHSVRDSCGRKRDIIADFDAHDLIDLSAIDARSGSGNQAFRWIGRDEFNGRKGELHYEKKGSKVLVEGDRNGDGEADFQLLVANTRKLTASDFDL